jgi:hypothetical protein
VVVLEADPDLQALADAALSERIVKVSPPDPGFVRSVAGR